MRYRNISRTVNTGKAWGGRTGRNITKHLESIHCSSSRGREPREMKESADAIVLQRPTLTNLTGHACLEKKVRWGAKTARTRSSKNRVFSRRAGGIRGRVKRMSILT